MPNDVHWLLQMTALGVQLQTAFSHINSFHATDNAVELMDCPNGFIANSTHALSLRTGSQQLGSSIPLGKGLSQVVKQLSRPRRSVLRELGLLNLVRHCQAQLKLSNISLILQSQPRTQCLQKLTPCLNLFMRFLPMSWWAIIGRGGRYFSARLLGTKLEPEDVAGKSGEVTAPAE